MHFFCIFLRKNLVISKFCSTFAPAFQKALPNCVMVALQILVLSVWVRVLVRQQSLQVLETFFVGIACFGTEFVV